MTGSGGARQCAVLVVDDDEVLLRSCERHLRHRAQVFTARTPSEARRIAREKELDAIVVDYKLGEDDGVDLVRDLKAQSSQTKVLLWSGYASIDVVVAAMRAGADGVRAKPVAPNAVMRWIETDTWQCSGGTETASLDRVSWDYMQRVVSECGHNISEAARRLGIERATAPAR